MKEKKEDLKCCFCGNAIKGHGNNPSPLKTKSKDDVCCDECNFTKVIPSRMGFTIK